MGSGGVIEENVGRIALIGNFLPRLCGIVPVTSRG